MSSIVLYLILGVTSPHITPVQLDNQLFQLRFSACTYIQQGNFHKEHCKGAWPASLSLRFDTNTYNNSQKKKQKKTKKIVVLSVLPLCVTVAVSSVFVLCGPFVYLYIHWCFFIDLYFLFNIIQNYLFAMYILIYNRAGPFHLLLPSV